MLGRTIRDSTAQTSTSDARNTFAYCAQEHRSEDCPSKTGQAIPRKSSHRVNNTRLGRRKSPGIG